MGHKQQAEFWILLFCCAAVLHSIPQATALHYRYLWRNCYPCYLGQAGYGSVGHSERRPGKVQLVLFTTPGALLAACTTA